MRPRFHQGGVCGVTGRCPGLPGSAQRGKGHSGMEPLAWAPGLQHEVRGWADAWGTPHARGPAGGSVIPWHLPGPRLPGWLILLVAELKRPPASEVVGEGIKLATGSAVCGQNVHVRVGDSHEGHEGRLGENLPSRFSAISKMKTTMDAEPSRPSQRLSVRESPSLR